MCIRDGYEGVPLHFIGNLQTNKVKYLIGKVSLIQSVDSLKLAREIGRLALRAGIWMCIRDRHWNPQLKSGL